MFLGAAVTAVFSQAWILVLHGEIFRMGMIPHFITCVFVLQLF